MEGTSASIEANLSKKGMANAMYLAIDIGGTKTLVASFTNSGKLHEQIRFATPKKYPDFLAQLQKTIKELSVDIFQVAAVAAPGLIDRKKGIVIAFGNLPWKNVTLKKDIKKLVHCPVVLENDAKLAGLSEALHIRKKYNKVLYITISTGISAGLVVDGKIDPELADSEAGHMKVQYNDRLQIWEDIASGQAIKKRYGKIAADINNKKTWKEITHRFAIGINGLIAIIQPEVIVIGGGVGSHFHKFGKLLKEELQKYATPLTPVPPIIGAKHPEHAVIYGCYQLAKEAHENTLK